MIEAAIAFALQQAAAPAPPPPPCASEAHAGFDFWVGEWEVYPAGGDRQVANSRIERKHRGCAVVESWMPLRGEGGTSLNHYDAATGQWHQKWVGEGGEAVEFVGGVTDGRMVLTGTWPGPKPETKHQLIRMTYSVQGDGSVRQYGQASLDHGLTWGDAFDFIYRRKDGAGK